MHPTISVKSAVTEFGVSDLITARFSPRAFSQKPLEEQQLFRFFEAASWAPSANNEQPWQYQYALKGTPGFHKIWACLMAGNQPWAQHASALVISIARQSFASSGKPNGAALHDLGMANANFLLQAAIDGIYGHPMGGFDREKLITDLELTPDQNPVCIIALGYLGEPESLEEPFLTREKTPRTRLKVADFAKGV